jgi:hypothetical protein
MSINLLYRLKMSRTYLLLILTFVACKGDAPQELSEADVLCSAPCGLDVQEDIFNVDEGAVWDSSDVLIPSEDVPGIEDSKTGDVGTNSDLMADILTDIPPDISDIPDVVEPPKALKVLFIGNSYTYQNDLPNMVDKISAETPNPIVVDSITKGGAWLQNHAADALTIETIQTGGWTHVILQEQSILPVVASGTFIFAAADLSAVIHEAQAIPVFFETWARAEGNSLYSSDLAGYTPQTMQEELRFRYKLAATNNDGLYAPVGDAWEISLAEHPEITLHSGDGSHPAKTGSFLAACVLYEIVTGSDILQTTWAPNGVSDTDATNLRTLSHQVVNNP